VPDDAERCPSCGAVLLGQPDDDAAIPGVTAIDPSLPLRRSIARPNRLVRLIAGDLDVLPPDPPVVRPARGGTPGGAAAALEGAGQAAVAPPSDEVRREMARLELEAIRAGLESRSAEVAPDGGGDTPA
jgi:hypothetical protein